MQHQFDPGQPCQSFAGQIVQGGTQTAGDDDEVRSLSGQIQGRDHDFKVVGNRGMPGGFQTELLHPSAQPGTVGVELLSVDEFRADGNDFRTHGVPLVFRQSNKSTLEIASLKAGWKGCPDILLPIFRTDC
jgi:hypothetical protein